MPRVRFGELGAIAPRSLFGLAVRWLQRSGELPGLSAYHITMPKGARHPPAYHKKRDELIFVLEGSGTLRVDRRRRRLKPGTIVHIPAGRIHEVTTGRGGLKVLSLFCPAMDPRSPDVHLAETHGR